MFDVVALGVGSYCLGSEALRAGHEICRFWTRAIHAKTDADLDAAASYFAHAISVIGVNTILIIFARRIGKAGNFQRSLARWTTYIEDIEFKPPRDRGALWSKLKESDAEISEIKRLGGNALPDGADSRLAMDMAKRMHGRLTMESSLPPEFFKIYETQFQKGTKSPVTEKIWNLLSKKWAASLRGEVVAYIDSEEVISAINSGKPPVLITELKTIRDLVTQNRAITAVVFEDIWNPRIRTHVITIPELSGLLKH